MRKTKSKKVFKDTIRADKTVYSPLEVVDKKGWLMDLETITNELAQELWGNHFDNVSIRKKTEFGIVEVKYKRGWTP